MKIVILLVATMALTAAELSSSKIDSQLQRKLNANKSANIFISFTAGTSKVYEALAGKTFANRGDKGTKVNALLKGNAEESQAEVLAFLNKNHFAGDVKSFWISNQIYIKNAGTALVNRLAEFAEVSKITEEGFATIDIPVVSSAEHKVDANDELTWGLLKVQAADVWNHTEGGNQGEGVVVGGIDTGVRYTHEALSHNFRGDYGWLDPTVGELEPFDDNGHGTHTIGTIAGSHGIGVAPQAIWMACKGCATDRCANSDLLACGEFMQCPTLADGSAEDCSKAPKIVSNSWTGGGGNDFYYPIVEAWHASEIVPVFANGNRQDSHPICGGAGSPADHPLSIGVGNTQIDDSLAESSCQGPTTQGTIKPDISAPGTDVISAGIGSDTEYAAGNGTSMATPHIAGIVALLVSRKPDLTVDEIRDYLIAGVEQDGLLKRGDDCGGVSEDIYPNNAFGYGRVSALNSFNRLIEDGH